jgi:MFS family permease
MASESQPPQLVAQPFRLRSLGLSVYLPTFLFAVGQGAVIPIIPLHATNLGATIAVAGLIVALRGIGTMVFDVPAGIMVGRFGERTSMLIGTLALAGVAFGAGLSQSVWQFALLIFVMGWSWSIWLLARLTYVSDQAPLEQRGRALSLLGGSNRIGNFVGPFIGGFAGVTFGLQSAFYVQAALALVAAGLMVVLARGEERGGDVYDSSVYQRLAGVVRENRRVFMTAGLAAVALQVLRNSRQVVLPLWGASIGLDAAAIGVLFGLSSAIDMTLFYPAGIVMDRFGRKWAGVPCLTILAVGMMLIPLTDSFTSLLLVGLLIGFGNGLGSGIVMTLGADFSPPSTRGEFLGVWRLIGDTGTAGGPLVVGLLTGLVTLGAASVAVGGIGLIGAAIMLVLVEEPLKRRRIPPPA